MTARNKPRRAAARRGPADIRDGFKRHLEDSLLLDSLLEECRKLQVAGKIREARRIFKRCEVVHARILAVEEQYRSAWKRPQ